MEYLKSGKYEMNFDTLKKFEINLTDIRNALFEQKMKGNYGFLENLIQNIDHLYEWQAAIKNRDFISQVEEYDSDVKKLKFVDDTELTEEQKKFKAEMKENMTIYDVWL